MFNEYLMHYKEAADTTFRRQVQSIKQRRAERAAAYRAERERLLQLAKGGFSVQRAMQGKRWGRNRLKLDDPGMFANTIGRWQANRELESRGRAPMQTDNQRMVSSPWMFGKTKVKSKQSYTDKAKSQWAKFKERKTRGL